MDYNHLLAHHQIALIGVQNGASAEERQSAKAFASIYAEQIATARAATGQSSSLIWSQD